MHATAVIVAHPDDETIWCGGLILRHPQWDWTVLALSRADDANRAPRFGAACEALGATGLMADLDDSSPPAPIDPAREIAPRVLDALGHRRWDLIVTHGPAGEYGHPRHRQVHAEVLRLVESGQLPCRALWSVACLCDPVTARWSRDGPADVEVALTADELARKRGIVREQYNFPPGSFELRACSAVEWFRHTWPKEAFA